jgi:hypothetical protein
VNFAVHHFKPTYAFFRPKGNKLMFPIEGPGKKINITTTSIGGCIIVGKFLKLNRIYLLGYNVMLTLSSMLIALVFFANRISVVPFDQ